MVQVIDNVKAGIERRVQAQPWLDHLVRTAGRYQRQRGNYYAAGITYFTVLSLFPLLMIAFAVAGLVLSSNPDLLEELRAKIVENIPGSFGTQVNDLVDQAVESRGAVGVLGLLTGVYSGLGWMANLRAALTEQWEQKSPDGNWLMTKLSDLGALVGLGLAFTVSLWLSSTLLGFLASWAVFAWVIARLPREPVTLASAVKAAALAAVVFEVFKIVASIYLRSVLNSPAGATFGSIIGLMVFSYVTYRIVLFATAWAATATENEPEAEIPAPGPAVIAPRVSARDISVGAGATYFGAGALAALALSGLRKLPGRR
jgi:membrane protein